MKFQLRFAAVALALVACAARADQVADVDALFRGGKQQEALAQAERYLKAQPRDARMRFLRGVMLTDLGRTDDAIEAFRLLNSDFPELPEPYNNLAVIYAARGQYEMARDALETAVRNNPRYTTGQENLGDVYVQLAREAYLRAQGSLDKTMSEGALTRKLTLVRELLSQSAQAKP